MLGFTDAPEFAGQNPFAKVGYDRDALAGVVRKYLEPTFQCDVHSVVSSAGNAHPVVVVPPHGAVPICAKGNKIRFRLTTHLAGVRCAFLWC